MRARIRIAWQAIQSSYWFLPSLMLVGSALLAIGVVELDDRIGMWLEAAPGWLSTFSAENARAVLTTIGSSMVAMAGVTFSIVIVALTVASSQFGPLLLINFMRDRSNQIVLGTFVSTFLYCLLALRHVHAYEASGQSPPLTVLTGVLLGVLSLWVFIYFIHHVSTSIQADQIVALAGEQLERAVHRKASDSEQAADVELAEQAWLKLDRGDADARRGPLLSNRTGYLSRIEIGVLTDAASDGEVAVEIDAQPGDFLVAGTRIGSLVPAERCDDEELTDSILGALEIVRRRGSALDVMLLVDRLTGIAVRALSPGVNDPYTALLCIDRLTASLTAMAEADPRRRVWAEDSQPRLRLRPLTFEQLLARGCEPILTYGSSDPRIVERLQQMLQLLRARASRPEVLHAIELQREAVDRAAG
jgi:uncharacterized membrane protein